MGMTGVPIAALPIKQGHRLWGNDAATSTESWGRNNGLALPIGRHRMEREDNGNPTKTGAYQPRGMLNTAVCPGGR